MTSVYLAGPISGLTFLEAVDWRDYAKAELSKSGITGLSPMRFKDYLSDLESISHKCDVEAALNVLSTPEGILSRDHFDANRCDVLLVNFLGARDRSLGTAMEVAWAFHKKTPIVVVMEQTGNPNDHAMINAATNFRVETLDDGLAVIRAILEVGA